MRGCPPPNPYVCFFTPRSPCMQACGRRALWTYGVIDAGTAVFSRLYSPAARKRFGHQHSRVHPATTTNAYACFFIPRPPCGQVRRRRALWTFGVFDVGTAVFSRLYSPAARKRFGHQHSRVHPATTTNAHVYFFIPHPPCGQVRGRRGMKKDTLRCLSSWWWG